MLTGIKGETGIPLKATEEDPVWCLVDMACKRMFNHIAEKSLFSTRDCKGTGLFLSRPVHALDTVKCQVDVRQAIPRLADLLGLKKTDVSISKQIVAGSLPAPPSLVFVFRRSMITVPFADENLLGWPGHAQASLRYRRLNIIWVEGVLVTVHRINLLGTVVKAHRVGIAERVPGGVLGTGHDRRAIIGDLATNVRVNRRAPNSHPEPEVFRKKFFGAGICLLVCLKVQVHRQIDLFEVVRALDAHRGRPGFAKSGHKYGKQQSDDRYNNQQLDKAKAGLEHLLCCFGAT